MLFDTLQEEKTLATTIKPTKQLWWWCVINFYAAQNKVPILKSISIKFVEGINYSCFNESICKYESICGEKIGISLNQDKDQLKGSCKRETQFICLGSIKWHHEEN